MGVQKISPFEGERRRQFTRALLTDLRALERMLAEGMLEEGVRRIGAEQELFLVDRAFHPAPAALQMLEALKDPHYTTELGLFQLELNADPQRFSGDCLARMEAQIRELVGKARAAARAMGHDVVLTGILPTLRKSDLGLENMVPSPRYKALNEEMTKLRGEEYEISIRGVDDLRIKHDSVMVEACCGSFQVHLQVGAAEFANLYNLSLALAGPVLAAATNSPLLFGRRLWSETRIAVFQQAVDTRSSSQQRHVAPRVQFGDHWLRRSVLELFREDIARFRALVGTELDEDPFQKLDRGVAPDLRALRLHNGTIYRWNRACYGIIEGRPHLRIENRVFPSGPSIPDQVANGAFWLGLMTALAARYPDITKVMEFDHAKSNFVAGARQGLAAQITWLEGEEISVPALVLERLLPLANEGLKAAGVDDADRTHYLGIVERRVSTGRTGARWQVQSLAAMKEHGTLGERLQALTAAIVARQVENQPVAEWPLAELTEGGGWQSNYLKVEQYMTTDLYTVHPDDPVELAANVMEWQKIRHVPVEDHEHRLIGLVSYRALLRLMAHGKLGSGTVPVSEVMREDPVTVDPSMPTLRAIEVMRQFGVGCLPVVLDGRLVGIVTEHDFMGIARQLLEQRLQG